MAPGSSSPEVAETQSPFPSELAGSIFDQIIVTYELFQPSQPFRTITLVKLLRDAMEDRDSFHFLFLSFVYREIHGIPQELEHYIHEPSASEYDKIVSFLPTFMDLIADMAPVLGQAVSKCGLFLMDNFFLQLGSQGGNSPTTSQPSSPALPTSDTSSDRLQSLYRRCMVRDRHRCVVTRSFDNKEKERRMEAYGNDAKDDCGRHFKRRSSEATLKLTHIIPHHLKLSEEDEEKPKQFAWRILKMFSPSTMELIEGAKFDRPLNAMMLEPKLHDYMREFKVAFEAVDGRPHRYKIDYSEDVDDFSYQNFFGRHDGTTLVNSEGIEMVSPRLLEIHHAIMRMLRLTGVRKYFDRPPKTSGD